MTNHRIRIYTDLSPIAEGALKNLSPLLSSHWNGLDKKKIFSNRSNPRSQISVVNRPGAADFFALPMHWSYYLWNRKAKMDEAIRLAEIAAEWGKKIIVWHKGDLVPVIPFKNAIVFAPGFLKSEFLEHYRACPVFVDDPKPIYGVGQSFRNWTEKPSVGFCGFGSTGLRTLWSTFRRAQLKLISHFLPYDYSGLTVLPESLLRARALKLLSEDPRIETNFIVRDRFTGPASTPQDSDLFFSNIYSNDYTLCVRGYGNWSYRFYQTLASGRIPVFIDTDCVLPLSSRIEWKEYCVWIDNRDIKYISEKLTDFHSALTHNKFVELQSACRELWEKHFTPESLVGDLRSYLFDEASVNA